MAKVAKTMEIEAADPPKMRLYLPNAEKMVEGVHNVGIGKKVSLEIRGEVRSFNDIAYMEGADIEVKPSAVTIKTDEEEISLDDAISAAEETV